MFGGKCGAVTSWSQRSPRGEWELLLQPHPQFPLPGFCPLWKEAQPPPGRCSPLPLGSLGWLHPRETPGGKFPSSHCRSWLVPTLPSPGQGLPLGTLSSRWSLPDPAQPFPGSHFSRILGIASSLADLHMTLLWAFPCLSHLCQRLLFMSHFFLSAQENSMPVGKVREAGFCSRAS